MAEILESSECPKWVVFPDLYINLLKENKHLFLPWFLFYEKYELLGRWEILRENYPKRTLFPFARRDDNDDIACWEQDKPGKVVIIHDYASPGWEQRQIFDSFEDWYAFALSEMDEDYDKELK